VGRTPAWEGAYREFFVARQRSLMRTAYAILGSWPAADHAHLGQWVFITQFVCDSSYVSVSEVIVASSLEEARSHRTLDHDAVVGLVTDPRLSFPRP